MDRAGLLRFLAATVIGRRIEGRPFKVGIDGRCASGKSNLVEELSAELGGLQVLRVSVDGFHRPREQRYRQGEDSARGYYEDAFDYAAVVDNLLRPLSGESFPVLCREASLDLSTNRLVDSPPVSVSGNVVLLFEGVFALRKELDSYWDLRILVDVDAATSVTRAVARDAGLMRRAGVERKYRVRYEPAWLLYESDEKPEARADIVIDNSDLGRPRVTLSAARLLR